MMNAETLKLYRKRIIPAECRLLNEDKIEQADDEVIITSWTTINPKADFCRGASCYFLNQGIKVSKFYRHDGSLLYWYCDIIETEYDETENTYTFTPQAREAISSSVDQTDAANVIVSFTMPASDVDVLVDSTIDEHYSVFLTRDSDVDISIENGASYKVGENVTIDLTYGPNTLFSEATVQKKGVTDSALDVSDTILFDFDYIRECLMDAAPSVGHFVSNDSEQKELCWYEAFRDQEDGLAYAGMTWADDDPDGLFQPEDYLWECKAIDTDGDTNEFTFVPHERTMAYTVNDADKKAVTISFTMPDSDVEVEIRSDDDFTEVSTWGELSDALSSGLNAKLTSNVIAGEHDSALSIPSGARVTLDPNGFVIDRQMAGKSATTDGGVFTITDLEDSSYLLIHDHSDGEAVHPYYVDANGLRRYVESETDSEYVAAASKGVTKGGVITGGSAAGNGGAFYLEGDVTLSICDVTVAGNNAAGSGGAIYTKSHNIDENICLIPTIIVMDSAVEGNTASTIGGVYLSSDSTRFETNFVGTAKISGNSNGNLYIPNGVNLGTILLDDGASIGVTMENPGPFANFAMYTDEENPLAIARNFFTSDNSAYYIDIIDEDIALVRRSSSGSSSSGGSSAGTTVTIPVSGDDASVSVAVRVKGSTASITGADIEKVLAAEDVGTVTIDVSSLDSKVDEVVVPATLLRKVADAAADEESNADGLEVKLPGGAVTFDADALNAIRDQSGGKELRLNLKSVKESGLNTAQRKSIGSMDIHGIYDVSLTSGGTSIHDFQGGKASVSVSYTLKEGQLPKGVTVYYIANDGTVARMPTSYANGMARWEVEHFSNYVIAYEQVCPQDDTCPMSKYIDMNPTAWYHDGVHWALEAGVMTGSSDIVFDPNLNTSRAMLATMLWRIEGKPVVNFAMRFEDVEADTWYTEGIRWANSAGIITGYGDTDFGPNDPVTREQLAVMLHRYAQYKGMDVSVGEDTNILSYEDAFDVSEWAVPAIQWAVGADIIQGVDKDGTLTLAPRAASSRAVVATMLMRLFANDAV